MATPKRIQKPMPLRGRRTAWPPDMIGQDYTPNALNVRFKFGEARPAPGRKLFDGAIAAQKALLITNFSRSNNIIWPMLFTDHKLFRFGNATPGDVHNWVEILGTFVPSGTRRWGTCVGEDKIFFSNGADEIAYWDGVVGNQFDLIKNVAGFEGIGSAPTTAPHAEFLEYFNNRVLAANVEENGNIISNRIRWSQNGDFRKWNETQLQGAGFLDLNEEGAEAIKGIKSLGDRCVVYKRNSIGDLTPTGTLSPVFVHETRIRGIGVGAPYTIGSTGHSHFFLGNDHNVWMWDGAQITPIGKEVQEELKSLTYRDAFDKYFGVCIPSRYEYWLLISDDVRGATDVFVYDYLRNYWTRDTFPNIYTIGEIDVPQIVYIWLTIPGIWPDWLVSWADLNAALLTEVIGGRTDSVTMNIDEQFADDYFAIGSIIDRVLETEDMYVDTYWDLAQSVRVLLNYEFVNDEPFEISVSFDRGRTWTSKQITPNQRGYSFVEFAKSGNVIRYRFRENNALGQFRWRSYMADYLPIGDFIGTDTA